MGLGVVWRRKWNIINGDTIQIKPLAASPSRHTPQPLK